MKRVIMAVGLVAALTIGGDVSAAPPTDAERVQAVMQRAAAANSVPHLTRITFVRTTYGAALKLTSGDMATDSFDPNATVLVAEAPGRFVARYRGEGATGSWLLMIMYRRGDIGELTELRTDRLDLSSLGRVRSA